MYHVFKAVEMAVHWGRQRMNLDNNNIFSIGVDEVLWHRGHKYLTLIYHIDPHRRRLLWIGKNRHKRTLEVQLYHTIGDLPEQEFTHKFF
jgi:hypothetical protein